MPPSQTRVEVDVIGAQASVARGSNGPLIRGVIVAVHLSSGQQVERMPAVVRENWSQLKTRQDTLFPRTVDHTSEHDFVPFVTLRKTTIQIEVCRILRPVVGVVIRGSVNTLTPGVIREH